MWLKNYYNYFKTMSWQWLIILGLINPLLFFANSPWFLVTKKIPISPIPLVFDAPKNVPYWSYQYFIEYHTSNKTETFQLTNKLMKNYPRSIMMSSFYLMILTAVVINPDSKEDVNYVNNILCYGFLQVYGFVPFEDKLYKTSLIILDSKGVLLKKQEVLCH